MSKTQCKKEFRIKKLEDGSSKFGVCEVCKNHVDTTYLMTEVNVSAFGKSEGRKWFGHKNCLALTCSAVTR